MRSRVNNLPFEHRQICEILGLRFGLKLRWRLLRPRLTHDYAAVFTGPHALFFVQGQQATALALCRQPD